MKLVGEAGSQTKWLRKGTSPKNTWVTVPTEEERRGTGAGKRIRGAHDRALDSKSQRLA